MVFSDNASNDCTRAICAKLCRSNRITTIYHRTELKGKGNAVRESWQSYPANQYWFMDLDMSTHLFHLNELRMKLQEDPIVVGSRLLPESQVTRSLKREIASRGYNLLLELLFDKQFSDAQCGFKGVQPVVVEKLLPLTRSMDYFFDTELLLLAQANNFDIAEIPVFWEEGAHSKIRLYRSIPCFLQRTLQHYLRTRFEPKSLLID